MTKINKIYFGIFIFISKEIGIETLADKKNEETDYLSPLYV